MGYPPDEARIIVHPPEEPPPAPACQSETFAVRPPLKIRSHLLLLASATLLPLLLFSVGLTAFFWWHQRNALELRQLERVRAMTIALDTELQASIRVMRVLGLSPQLQREEMPAFADNMRAVISTQPLWAVLAVGDNTWREVIAVTPGGEEARRPVIHEATRRQVLERKLPGVSPLLNTDGRYYTQLIVPIVREADVELLIMVAIDQRSWLGFMSQYPVGPSAILTLVDQDGFIIARTFHNDETVGRPPPSATLDHTRKTAEAAFRNVSLEGAPVYSAHSRSIRWGWTLITSIPAETVEESLRESSWVTAAVAIASIALAVLLAFLFGRRIERPVAELGTSALALERGEEPRPVTGEIDEVQEVAHAFAQASSRLRERQAALNGALAGEQQARREAEQANRAKDEFLAMLGHELRNPLNAVASASAVLQHAQPRSEQSQRAMEIIGRQIVNLRELVDDLLDVARVTSGKITLDRGPLDMGRVVRRTAMVMSGSGKLGDHRVDVDAGEAWVEGDETRIEQVVTNLLDNAAKYTPPGGRIGVRVRAEDDEAVLEVEDTGMGIAPELLPRVFDLFSQGERTIDRAQGGLGLGLALVRRLVELHGGTVTASSRGAGQGARFTVRLKRIEAPHAAAAARDEPGADEQKRLRILIVEDNPDGRETLAMLLGMQGHEIHEAETGPGGVECALKVKPDAAVVDIGLPGFDGYEVARRLRASPETSGTRLIALTGYGQEDDRQNAFRAGFDSFLVKPADMAALNTILASV